MKGCPFQGLLLVGYIIRVNLGTETRIEVDGIACEIVHVDLGGVHLDDGPVLSITLAATADADRRREDDMTQNAALRGGPASRNVLVKGFEPHSE